jgi:hypothetical protein
MIGVCWRSPKSISLAHQRWGIMESIAHHFERAEPRVRETYDRLLAAARAMGRVGEEGKKTSIHLMRRTAFAGVATQKSAIILTLKASEDIESPRIVKHEQASANRWHLNVRLDDPRDVDAELRRWLKRAYELAE